MRFIWLQGGVAAAAAGAVVRDAEDGCKAAQAHRTGAPIAPQLLRVTLRLLLLLIVCCCVVVLLGAGYRWGAAEGSHSCAQGCRGAADGDDARIALLG